MLSLNPKLGRMPFDVVIMVIYVYINVGLIDDPAFNDQLWRKLLSFQLELYIHSLVPGLSSMQMFSFCI